MRRSVLALLLALGFIAGTGCIGKEGTPAASSDADDLVDPAASDAAQATSPPTPPSADNKTASESNATATDGPSDPSNCMRGMDMPGCTQAQADAYFDERAKNAPPPDKPLDPFTITLDPQGADQTGAFSVDNGTTVLLIEFYLRNSGQGPYAALGADPAGNMEVEFVGESGSTVFELGGASIGVDPASALDRKSMAMLPEPSAGGWTVTFLGQGTNVELEIRIVERFSR